MYDNICYDIYPMNIDSIDIECRAIVKKRKYNLKTDIIEDPINAIIEKDDASHFVESITLISDAFIFGEEYRKPHKTELITFDFFDSKDYKNEIIDFLPTHNRVIGIRYNYCFYPPILKITNAQNILNLKILVRHKERSNSENGYLIENDDHNAKPIYIGNAIDMMEDEDLSPETQYNNRMFYSIKERLKYVIFKDIALPNRNTVSLCPKEIIVISESKILIKCYE